MITCLLATLLSLGQAAPAIAQSRFTDANLVVAMQNSQGAFRNARFDVLAGDLVVDTAARQIRFEANGKAVFAAPFDRITALHYEVTTYPVRAFRQANHFLAIYYTRDDSQPESRVIRLAKDKAPAVLASVERETGMHVDQSPETMSMLGLTIHLAVGDRVFVLKDSGREVQDRVTEVLPTGFTLAKSPALDMSSIQRIEVSDPMWDGALFGALAALIPAGLVSGSTCSDSCSTVGILTPAGWGIIALGAAVGAGIDSSINRVAFRRTGPSPTRHVLVVPVATPSERSVRVFIRF